MRDRRRGYLEAMRTAGLAPPAGWTPERPITMDGGRDGIAALLGQRDRPRAVFCSSDVMAAGAIFECQRQGLRVPEDIAITGYDDLDLAAHIRPALSTVRIPRFEIGVRAAEMIDEALAGRPIAERSIDMGFRIMWRESA